MRFLSEIKSELKPNFWKKSKKNILNSCPIRFEGPANEHLYTSKVRVCRAILFLKTSRRFQICYAADPATVASGKLRHLSNLEYYAYTVQGMLLTCMYISSIFWMISISLSFRMPDSTRCWRVGNRFFTGMQIRLAKPNITSQ